MTPALLIRMSSFGSWLSSRAAQASTDFRSARSTCSNRTRADGIRATIRETLATPFSGLRLAMITSAPARASTSASSNPSPPAPVTTAVRPR